MDYKDNIREDVREKTVKDAEKYKNVRIGMLFMAGVLLIIMIGNMIAGENSFQASAAVFGYFCGNWLHEYIEKKQLWTLIFSIMALLVCVMNLYLHFREIFHS